jgi:hypothetical protein
MTRLRATVLLVLALSVAGIAAGCGEEEELDVVEGEPLELGDVHYNVQITRFLNPEDAEDQGYLVGQEPADPGSAYLAVFLTIDNESEESVEVPAEFEVVDTAGTTYEPVPSGSDYAIQLPGQDEAELTGIEPGEVNALQPTTIPPGGEIPVPDSSAAEGVIGGAMLLFLVDQNVAENRPLELEIPGEDGESGTVELDI